MRQVLQAVDGGQEGDRRGGRLLVGPPGRDRRHQLGRGRREGGQAGRRDGHHPVADPVPLHTAADRAHPAGALGAERDRSGRYPGADVQRLEDVAEVEPGRGDLDLHLSRAGPRARARGSGQAVEDPGAGGEDAVVGIAPRVVRPVLPGRVGGTRYGRHQRGPVPATAAQRQPALVAVPDLVEQAGHVVAGPGGIQVDDGRTQLGVLEGDHRCQSPQHGLGKRRCLRLGTEPLRAAGDQHQPRWLRTIGRYQRLKQVQHRDTAGVRGDGLFGKRRVQAPHVHHTGTPLRPLLVQVGEQRGEMVPRRRVDLELGRAHPPVPPAGRHGHGRRAAA